MAAGAQGRDERGARSGSLSVAAMMEPANLRGDYDPSRAETAPRRDFLGHGEAAPASADNSHIQGFEIRQTIPSRR